MPSARLTPLSALAAACAGASAWCSLGTLALSDAGPRASRVGLLPPLWWLAALVAGGVGLAWALRLRPDRARPLFASALLFLPWLPVRLPLEALLWTGPIVWLVWAGIAAAVLSAGAYDLRTPAWLRALMTNPARAPWAAFFCAAIIYSAASWRLAPRVPGGDEPHYLVIAQSLWRDGDLRIENNHQRGDYLEYFGGALRPDYLKRGTDGQIYSIHLPGISVLVAPVLALGGYGAVKLLLAILSAAATAIAWRAAYQVTGSIAAAWFGWAGVALAAPVLLLSFTIYPDGPGAVVLMLAFGLVAALHRRASRPAWWWASAGALAALLPWFHPRFALLAAALGLVFVLRALRDSRPARALAAFSIVPAASAMGWFGYYYAIYGRFNPSVAYGHYTQMSFGRAPTGLLGLLFDQQYGLLIYAPVFAIGLAGLVPLARRHPRLAAEWCAVVVPYTIVTAMYHMWWGGFSSPARFIGATLLLFAVPLAAAWTSTTRAATRALHSIALGAGLAVTMMLLIVERGEFVFNVRNAAAPWLVWASQMADLTRAVPSLFRQEPGIALAEAAAWAAAVLGTWLVARTAERTARLAPGASALLMTCGICVAATAAAAGAWRIEGATGARATFGQLRMLDAAGTSRAAHGVLLDTASAVGPAAAVERLRVGAEAFGSSGDDWLTLPYLPAGRYVLWVDMAAAASFDVSLLSGRSDGPFASWSMAGDGAGAQSHDVMLPVGVAGVRVVGPAAARPAVRGVWFQPVDRDMPFKSASSRRAASARDYKRVVVYAVRGAYLEPGGLWTAGGQTAEFVVQAGRGKRFAAFVLSGGPIATRVHIESGMFVLVADLNPGEAPELSIPLSGEGSALVTMTAGRSFRPSEANPPSTDRRLLGVRLDPR